MNYLSHPEQKLTNHIRNIMQYDPNDAIFQIVVRYHDLGKVTENFQIYIQDTDNHTSNPHAPVSAIIYLLNHIKSDLTFEKNDLFIFNAILSHHGKLKSFKNEFGSDILEYFKSELPQQQIDEIYAKKDVLDYFNLKPIASSDFKKLRRKNRDLEFNIEDFITQKLLFSKLIFADKYEAIYKHEHHKTQNRCTLETLHVHLKKNLKKDTARDQIKADILDQYDEIFSIFTLTAPTGVGKTLTSLELALHIKETKSLQKIIYILPFTSIIDQTYEIFDTIFKDEITKHHYGVSFEEETDENNDYDRWKFLLNSWNVSFIVSTLYQLFFALFSNKNSDNIKFQALQNSVIVIDEVQAIPFELWKSFKAILPPLAKKLNTTFVLMSATMPILTEPTLAKELANKKSIFGQKNRYCLSYLSSNDLDDLAENIIKAYKKGQSVLCVLNSIKTSKMLYKKVYNIIGNNCLCLNSYMFYDDRKNIIDNIKDLNSNNVSKKVLISTQVIEAGVDLDFDVGFREFAPVSSIIQTAGRVNREATKGVSDIYIFDIITKVYDSTMILESRKNLLEQLPLNEEKILAPVENYFKAIDESKSDNGILKDIQNFDFASISKKNRDAFRLENDYIQSIVLGVDLKMFETDYYALPNDLKPYERKREKEKIIKAFQSKILNIKIKDINALGFTLETSKVFGLSYISNIEGIYSKYSGFLLPEEKNEDAPFF
ncbi:MAG: CRISPR-associated helicase Cas3' [Campylobacterota bacterium]|nr:CRISPR-associated helicase Cas3' [Campylobacterota bacterium]